MLRLALIPMMRGPVRLQTVNIPSIRGKLSSGFAVTNAQDGSTAPASVSGIYTSIKPSTSSWSPNLITLFQLQRGPCGKRVCLFTVSAAHHVEFNMIIKSFSSFKLQRKTVFRSNYYYYYFFTLSPFVSPQWSNESYILPLPENFALLPSKTFYCFMSKLLVLKKLLTLARWLLLWPALNQFIQSDHTHM